MYSISAYGGMISDRVRLDAYAEALRRAVKPGSVVLDIGTGIGFFAVLACRFGARRVHALEPADVIEVARAIAAANGCAERIEFIQEMSTKVSLTERADVVVTDLRGVLPLFRQSVASVIDARQRLLAPGGCLIPQRDTLWAAAVAVPESYARYTSPWDDRPYGIDMTAGRRLVTNAWSNRKVNVEQIVLPAQCWGTLDYSTAVEAGLRGSLSWTIDRPATAHGLLVWFDAVLADDVAFSNAPEKNELVYGRAFFPWSHPIAFEPGDTVTATISADPVGDDYVWRWHTRVSGGGEPKTTKVSFRQSTFYGALLSPTELRRQQSDHAPALTEDGEIDRFILSLMNGEHTLATIADRVAARFPNRFETAPEALSRAARLSVSYGRRFGNRGTPPQQSPDGDHRPE